MTPDEKILIAEQFMREAVSTYSEGRVCNPTIRALILACVGGTASGAWAYGNDRETVTARQAIAAFLVDIMGAYLDATRGEKR